MKSNYRKNSPYVLVILLLAMAIGVTSCNSGVSKEERLSAFKSDILADSNTREHFRGHQYSATIDSSTFDATTLIEDGPVEFTGQDIGDSTFTLYYNNSGDSKSSTGHFYYDDSDVLGASWFILDITVDEITFPVG